MKNILKKIGVAVGAAFAVAVAVPQGAAAADICASTTDCTLLLSKLNSGLAGSFGTVHLSLTGTNDVTVDIVMANGYSIITTGFPGGNGTNYSVAFNDSLAGTVTVSQWSPATSGSPGFVSSGTQSLSFDGFGSFNNGTWTNTGQGGSGAFVTALSFHVSGASSVISDVEQLVGPSASPAGQGNALWVVDVLGPNGTTTNLAGAFGAGGICPNGAPNFPICSPQVETPEPVSMAVLGVGLAGLGAARMRRRAA